jgi:hypothetical protein
MRKKYAFAVARAEETWTSNLSTLLNQQSGRWRWTGKPRSGRTRKSSGTQNDRQQTPALLSVTGSYRRHRYSFLHIGTENKGTRSSTGHCQHPENTHLRLSWHAVHLRSVTSWLSRTWYEDEDDRLLGLTAAISDDGGSTCLYSVRIDVPVTRIQPYSWFPLSHDRCHRSLGSISTKTLTIFSVSGDWGPSSQSPCSSDDCAVHGVCLSLTHISCTET